MALNFWSSCLPWWRAAIAPTQHHQHWFYHMTKMLLWILSTWHKWESSGKREFICENTSTRLACKKVYKSFCLVIDLWRSNLVWAAGLPSKWSLYNNMQAAERIMQNKAVSSVLWFCFISCLTHRMANVWSHHIFVAPPTIVYCP